MSDSSTEIILHAYPQSPVAGKIRLADAETVVIERTAEHVGTVCVHFPRSGYRIDIG